MPTQSNILIIKEIKGLGATATINMSDLATDDGSTFNSARLDKRTIEFSIYPRYAPDVETARQNTYKYFPIKRPVTLIFETDNRYAKITGYVEKNEPSIFSELEEIIISIVCDDPYFKDGRGPNRTDFSSIDPLFEFPFENNSLDTPLIEMGNYAIHRDKLIRYDGDAEVGVTMHMVAHGAVGDITIFNFSSNESMWISSDKIESLTGTGIQLGDEIIISTVDKNHYARLLRNGVYVNILNSVNRNSAWFKLLKGDNVFAYSTSNEMEEDLNFVIENEILYEGL